MKNFTKRAAALLLAVVLAFSLAGCYDDNLTWAAKMGDNTLPVGGYIYYLSTAYEEAAAKVDSEAKVLDSTIDGVDAEEWIIDRAQQYVNQYFWMDQEMERLGIEMTEADYDEATTTTTTYWNTYGFGAVFEEYGIAQSSFDLAYSQYSTKYLKIFETLYGEGGEKEVSEDELRDLYNSTYYSYEYFTVPMTLPDANGEAVDMTEEEIEALTENLEGMKEKVLKGDVTMEEAAEKYVEPYNLEESTYLTAINSESDLQSSYLPTEFIETLTAMDEEDVEVFEASTYMVVLRRGVTDDTADESLADESTRLNLCIELRNDEYTEYAETSAAAVEGIEMNSKALARYTPKMFSKDESVYGTSTAAEETTEEETADEETTEEESAE